MSANVLTCSRYFTTNYSRRLYNVVMCGTQCNCPMKPAAINHHRSFHHAMATYTIMTVLLWRRRIMTSPVEQCSIDISDCYISTELLSFENRIESDDSDSIRLESDGLISNQPHLPSYQYLKPRSLFNKKTSTVAPLSLRFILCLWFYVYIGLAKTYTCMQ